METNEVRKLDPVYCPACRVAMEFVPRDEKLRHVGKVIECSTCKKKYILNEGKYFVLEYNG